MRKAWIVVRYGRGWEKQTTYARHYDYLWPKVPILFPTSVLIIMRTNKKKKTQKDKKNERQASQSTNLCKAEG